MSHMLTSPVPVPRGGTDETNSESPIYPADMSSLPSGVITGGRYSARFALNPQDLESVQRLRFEVFNLELGEGLEESYRSGRDQDAFDPYCHHAMVMNGNQVVGTIRLQTRSMAQRFKGFYSAGEFRLSYLPEKAFLNSVEMGRACILEGHRNKQVLFLLWRTLARYLTLSGSRRLFGCCSLSSADPLDGRRAFHRFRRQGHLHSKLWVEPTQGHRCPGWDGADDLGPVQVPTLFKTYLRYGAKVCSPPALDLEFKTIDFFVHFDLSDLSPKKRRLFARELGDPPASKS